MNRLAGCRTRQAEPSDTGRWPPNIPNWPTMPLPPSFEPTIGASRKSTGCARRASGGSWNARGRSSLSASKRSGPLRRKFALRSRLRCSSPPSIVQSSIGGGITLPPCVCALARRALKIASVRPIYGLRISSPISVKPPLKCFTRRRRARLSRPPTVSSVAPGARARASPRPTARRHRNRPARMLAAGADSRVPATPAAAQ